jgi:Family of unknown function (DUF6084)
VTAPDVGRSPLLRPAPAFEVLGAAPVPHAAAPTLRFTLRVADHSGEAVHAIALVAQIQIDPATRTYDPATRERLVELFGAPERWAATTRSFLWAQVGAVVPAFRGEIDFTVDVPCTYDLEVAAAKYIHSLPGGEVPLTFHFSGTILHGQMQVAMVPWSCSAPFRLPVETWRALMAAHYPGGGWVRLEAETLDALARRKAASGLPTYDATLRELLG